MRHVTLLFLAALLASGCGSTPASPTPAAVTAPHAAALSLLFTPDAEPGQGWRSPTTVSLRYVSLTPPATVEKAVFRMMDDAGGTLAEASIAVGAPIAADGYLDRTGVVQTLTWPAERGYAKRLDVTLTIRYASGDLSTVTTSFPVK